MTEGKERRLIGLETWPANVIVEDLEALLAQLEVATVDDLANHVWGLLPEDPGAIDIDAGADLFTITSGQVTMWSLTFPFDGDAFDDYLFELDERATIQKVLDELPSEDDWTAAGRPDFTSKMAWLLRTWEEDFRAALGGDWHPLDLDWVGSTSNPSHFFWTGAAVVAIDNCNAYVFREAGVETGHELNGTHYEEVACVAGIWDGPGLRFDWFSPFVRDALADEPRGSCPSCGSGEVFHVLFGMPVAADALPTWVRVGGCVIDGEILDRVCESCGKQWRSLK